MQLSVGLGWVVVLRCVGYVEEEESFEICHFRFHLGGLIFRLIGQVIKQN